MEQEIVWTRRASKELADLHAYISEDSPSAADRQAEIVMSAVDRLINFPEKGRPGRRRRTRELVVAGTPYIVAYRVGASIIEILAILHGARRWPQSFKS
jgi:toxin ParE1/3/4